MVEVVWANELEIADERVGEGPPLVLVHGAAEDGRMWRPQLAAFADEFTVVAWDEPGAGRSSDVPADFGLADYANCLAALTEALALGPAHVAGISWGGTWARPPDLAPLRTLDLAPPPSECETTLRGACGKDAIEGGAVLADS